MIKTFEVDYNSLEACRLAANQLKTRIGQLQSELIGSRNDREKVVYDACVSIYETDISSIYSSLKLDESKIYYVYAHCDPRSNICIGRAGKSTFSASHLSLTHKPIYIGKGVGNRAYDLNRNESHRKVRQTLHKFDQELSVKIIKENLSEKEAFMLESKLIDIFGLMNEGGTLVNLDEGTNNKDRKFLYRDHLKKLNKLNAELMK